MEHTYTIPEFIVVYAVMIVIGLLFDRKYRKLSGLSWKNFYSLAWGRLAHTVVGPFGIVLLSEAIGLWGFLAIFPITFGSGLIAEHFMRSYYDWFKNDNIGSIITTAALVITGFVLILIFGGN